MAFSEGLTGGLSPLRHLEGRPPGTPVGGEVQGPELWTRWRKQRWVWAGVQRQEVPPRAGLRGREIFFLNCNKIYIKLAFAPF